MDRICPHCGQMVFVENESHVIVCAGDNHWTEEAPQQTAVTSLKDIHDKLSEIAAIENPETRSSTLRDAIYEINEYMSDNVYWGASEKEITNAIDTWIGHALRGAPLPRYRSDIGYRIADTLTITLRVKQTKENQVITNNEEILIPIIQGFKPELHDSVILAGIPEDEFYISFQQVIPSTGYRTFDTFDF